MPVNTESHATARANLAHLVKTLLTTSSSAPASDCYIHDSPEIRFDVTIAAYPRGIAYLVLLANGNKTGFGIYPAIYYYRTQRKVFVVYGQSKARPKITWDSFSDLQTNPAREIQQFFSPSELARVKREQPKFNYLDNRAIASFDMNLNSPDDATISAITEKLTIVVAEYASLYGQAVAASPMLSTEKAVQLTEEQAAIVNAPGSILKINAFAGSGKTSTLVAYAQNRPDKKILYLAFNRKICEEATMKFPSNVDSKTAHALACNALKGDYKPRTKDYRAYELCTHLDIDDLFTAQLVNDFCKYFLNSAATAMDAELFAEFQKSLPMMRLDDEEIKPIVAFANRFFALMQNRSIAPTFDFILKLYQLKRPALPYDIILFDEAQDASPVMLDIVLNSSCAKVFVGDRHQQIYSFRYAVNSLDRIDDAQEYFLTHSFRLGSKLAAQSSRLLREFKGESKAIKGANKQGKDRVGCVDRTKPYTYISRTNGNLFAMAATCRKEKKLACVKEFDAIFRDLLNVHYLASGQKHKISNPFISHFGDYRAMKNFAEEVDDKELKSLCKIVESHRDDFHVVYEEIRRNVASNHAGTADILLTTTHTAKGLEFEQVVLGDDFRLRNESRG